MSSSRTITISNKIEELEKVSEFLEEFCEIHEIPIKISNTFQIVIDELLSNTIFYGFSKKDKGSIEIQLTLEENIFVVVLIDDGKKFDPHDAPQPDLLNQDIENKQIGGLGINIVKKMTDSFKYERKKNKNIVTLSKKI
jgi:anti-sigma regulatory factor (Ser/Thr protein kinase)